MKLWTDCGLAMTYKAGTPVASEVIADCCKGGIQCVRA